MDEVQPPGGDVRRGWLFRTFVSWDGGRQNGGPSTFPTDPALRRLMHNPWGQYVVLSVLMFASQVTAAELGMGLRIGEVTQSSAIVWTRVTRESQRVWDGYRDVRGREPAEAVPVESRDGAMPGASGEVRLLYRPIGTAEARRTEWQTVGPERDFIHQFVITDLAPATKYEVTVEARSPGEAAASASVEGSFTTAAGADEWQDVSFAVVTGQMYKDLDDRQGFLVYPSMQRLGLQFLVSTGDTVYYDNDPPLATSDELARYHWQRMYSLPAHVEFHRHVPGYWEVDDHDILQNDCWPSMPSKLMRPLTFARGAELFREQVPMGDGPTHRTIRWGKGLQIWLVEGRLYRSPNNLADGPEKSIWGREQREWLMRSILESDADFKVLVSPTPIVGPDRSGKSDNHANAAFAWEGELFRRWTAEHRLDNLFVCCGDRHWQYVSVDPATGLREFSCGPVSDQHAGGSPGRDPEIQSFHRVKGGCLTVSVSQQAGRPTIAFRHHAVDGSVVNELVVPADR
ncbi:MAG: metallophosphoesterase family protein [Planctomycetaceae bacterium]